MGRFLRPGDEPVPNYKLIEFIGSGKFGQVWKASGPGGVAVALKIIESAGSVEGRKELRALRLLKDINHPFLVPLIGFWLKDENDELLDESSIDSVSSDESSVSMRGTRVAAKKRGQSAQLFIAMGLGEKTLFDRLQQCRDEGRDGIPVPELMTYMEDAAQAIDFLNKNHKIIHCDIKPQNILITAERARVCDFGLAKAIGNIRQTAGGKTLGYSAPEVDRGDGPSLATDQYSLAMSYYELRTGQLPIADEDARSEYTVIQAKCDQKLDLSLVTEAERDALAQALAADPSQRYANCRRLVQRLRGCFPDDESVANRAPLADSTPTITPVSPSGSDAARSPAEAPQYLKQTFLPGETTSADLPGTRVDRRSTTAATGTVPANSQLEPSSHPQLASEPGIGSLIGKFLIAITVLAMVAGGATAVYYGIGPWPNGGGGGGGGGVGPDTSEAVRKQFDDFLQNGEYEEAAKSLERFPQFLGSEQRLRVIGEWGERIDQLWDNSDPALAAGALEQRKLFEKYFGTSDDAESNKRIRSWFHRAVELIGTTASLTESGNSSMLSGSIPVLDRTIQWLQSTSAATAPEIDALTWRGKVLKVRAEAAGEITDPASVLVRIQELLDDNSKLGPDAATKYAVERTALYRLRARARFQQLAEATTAFGELTLESALPLLRDLLELQRRGVKPNADSMRVSLESFNGFISKLNELHTPIATQPAADRSPEQNEFAEAALQLLPAVKFELQHLEFVKQLLAGEIPAASNELKKLSELPDLDSRQGEKIRQGKRILAIIDPGPAEMPAWDEFLETLRGMEVESPAGGALASRLAQRLTERIAALPQDDPRRSAWADQLAAFKDESPDLRIASRLDGLRRLLIGPRIESSLFEPGFDPAGVAASLQALGPVAELSPVLRIAAYEAELAKGNPSSQSLATMIPALEALLEESKVDDGWWQRGYARYVLSRAMAARSAANPLEAAAVLVAAFDARGERWLKSDQRRVEALKLLSESLVLANPATDEVLTDPKRRTAPEIVRQIVANLPQLAAPPSAAALRNDFEMLLQRTQALRLAVRAAELLPVAVTPVGESLRSQWVEFATDCESVFGDVETNATLIDLNCARLISAASGLGLASRGGDPSDRQQAARRIDWAIAKNFNPRQKPQKDRDLTLFVAVVNPAVSLIDGWKDWTESPGAQEVATQLARLYLAHGRLTQRAEPSGFGASAARDSFARSRKLTPSVDALVGLGRATFDLSPPDFVSQLRTIVDDLAQLPDAESHPGALSLKALRHVLESSQLETRAARTLLEAAQQSLEKAASLPEQDEFASSILEFSSQTYLQSAFFSDTPTSIATSMAPGNRGLHLKNAVEKAQLATKDAGRRRPENALIALGNALEDHALYLGDIHRRENKQADFQKKHYADAIRAFVEAKDAVDTLDKDSDLRSAVALLNLGRCRLRFAKGAVWERTGAGAGALREADSKLLDDADIRKLLEQAESDLRESVLKFGDTDHVLRGEAYGRLSEVLLAQRRPELVVEAREFRQKGLQEARRSRRPEWSQWLQIAIDNELNQSRWDEVQKLFVELTRVMNEDPDFPGLRSLYESTLVLILQSLRQDFGTADPILRAALEATPLADLKTPHAMATLIYHRTPAVIREWKSASDSPSREKWKVDLQETLSQIESLRARFVDAAQASDIRDRARLVEMAANSHYAFATLSVPAAKEAVAASRNAAVDACLTAIKEYAQLLGDDGRAELVALANPDDQVVTRWSNWPHQLQAQMADQLKSSFNVRILFRAIYNDAMKNAELKPVFQKDHSANFRAMIGPLRVLEPVFDSDADVQTLLRSKNAFQNLQREIKSAGS